MTINQNIKDTNVDFNSDFDLIEENENSELYEHFRIIVDKGQRLLRIDKFLMSRLENTSRNKIQQAAKAGNILVNNIQIKSNYKVKPSDVISIVLPNPPRNNEILPENIPIEILFEDKHIVVVNKPANMVVHPGYANWDGTLLNALLWHFEANNDNATPLLVHRIDKDTSGVLLVAKTEEAQTLLAKQFFDHSIDRRYQAIVWGSLKQTEGKIIGNIGRSLNNRMLMAVFPDESHGKTAITHYKEIKNILYITLVECKLETGRTHQIRVHMQHIGHTIFGDERYGGNKILKGTTSGIYKKFIEECFEILPRQALHAKSLGFQHPITKKNLFFETELPDDMKKILQMWENYFNINL